MFLLQYSSNNSAITGITVILVVVFPKDCILEQNLWRFQAGCLVVSCLVWVKRYNHGHEHGWTDYQELEQ